MKKYELTGDTIERYGVTLLRIKALRDFGNILEGATGGYIEKENNLSHEGTCWVYGSAEVSGSAKVYGSMCVKYGSVSEPYNDLRDPDYIANSLGVFPIKGVYYLYKRVWRDSSGSWRSDHDSKFRYELNCESLVENPDEDDTTSCSAGIHVSTPFYWSTGDALIAVSVKVEDIVTCLEGKLRVRAATALDEVKYYGK